MSSSVLIPEEFWPLLVRVSITIAICVFISAAIVLMRRVGRRSAAPAAGAAETSSLIPRAVVWIVAACAVLISDVLGTMALAALLSVLAVQAIRELLRALAAAGAATDAAPVAVACLTIIVGAAFAGGAAFGSVLAVTLLLVAIYFMATTAPSSAVSYTHLTLPTILRV